MELTSLVINQVFIMFLLIATGYLCNKLKLISAEVNKNLSGLVLYLISPALIISSYQIEFKAELLYGLIFSFVLALVSMILAAVLGQVLIRSKQKDDATIERFVVVYSNCGFMGIPLVNSIYGAEGVFYVTAYVTVFNLLVWTHGVMLMKGELNLKGMLTVFKAPAIIATVAGIILFVARISLPSGVLSAVNYIGNMNTPMAMIVAGATIAQTKIGKALLKPRIYYTSAIRLLLVPVVTLLLFKALPINSTIVLTIVLAAACPAAAMVTLFSLNYNKNSLYASELFAVSTLLSAITLPLIVFLSGIL